MVLSSACLYLPHHGSGSLQCCSPAIDKLKVLAFTVLNHIIGQVEQNQSMLNFYCVSKGSVLHAK